jgi:hypothetical protein
MANAVAERTHELGVQHPRSAPSAETVVRLVLRRSARLAAAGVACGRGRALATTALIQSLLFGVTTDGCDDVRSISALLFCDRDRRKLDPDARALRVDPMVALRYE